MKLKIGIIGFEKESIELIASLSNYFTTIGIFDLNYPNLNSNLIKQTSEEVINDSDCVYFSSILTYFDDACYAIKKGKQIFISNLLALDISQVNTLFTLSTEASSIIQLNSPLRFEKATQLVSSNFTLPNLIHIQRTFIPEEHTNTSLQEILFYEIENIISLTKAKVRKTNSYLIPEYDYEIETIDARLEFDNGCTTTLLISSLFSEQTHNIKLYHQKNLISIDFISNEIQYIEERKSNTVNIDKEGIQRKNQDIFQAQLQNFHHSIITNATPFVTIEDGLQAIYITKDIISKKI